MEDKNYSEWKRLEKIRIDNYIKNMEDKIKNEPDEIKQHNLRIDLKKFIKENYIY